MSFRLYSLPDFKSHKLLTIIQHIALADNNLRSESSKPISKALARGDRIISINGKKIPENLTTAEEALDILYSHEKITLFALRPRKSDRGYKWVKKNT
jgi:hypothetical protein